MATPKKLESIRHVNAVSWRLAPGRGCRLNQQRRCQLPLTPLVCAECDGRGQRRLHEGRYQPSIEGTPLPLTPNRPRCGSHVGAQRTWHSSAHQCRGEWRRRAFCWLRYVTIVAHALLQRNFCATASCSLAMSHQAERMQQGCRAAAAA